MPGYKRKRSSWPARNTRRKYGTRKRRFRGKKTGTQMTYQKDSVVAYQYRKKKTPPGKLRLYRTIRNVTDRKLGSRTVMFYKRTGILNASSLAQIVFDVGLYTCRSTTAPEKNDLARIFSLENIGDQTALQGDTVDDTSNFIFLNGHLDFRIKNTSYTISDGVKEDAFQYIDIYEMVSSKTWEGATEVSPTGCFQTADTDTRAIDDLSANSMAITLKNVTPWDLPQAFTNYGIKILKKTSYCVEGGHEISYALHDSKRRVFNKNYIINKNRSNMPRVTKWLMIIARAGPNQTLGATNPTDLRQEIQFEVIRRYNYRIEGIHEKRDFYEAQ